MGSDDGEQFLYISNDLLRMLLNPPKGSRGMNLVLPIIQVLDSYSRIEAIGLLYYIRVSRSDLIKSICKEFSVSERQVARALQLLNNTGWLTYSPASKTWTFYCNNPVQKIENQQTRRTR